MPKITELTEITQAQGDDVLVVDNGVTTNKIKKDNLLKPSYVWFDEDGYLQIGE